MDSFPQDTKKFRSLLITESTPLPTVILLQELMIWLTTPGRPIFRRQELIGRNQDY
jgi:hypothetical protein